MNRDFLALIIVLGLSLAVNAKVDASLKFHTCQMNLTFERNQKISKWK